MSEGSLFWIAAAVFVVGVLGLLDGLKRRRVAEGLARMTPEEREIAKREAKASQSVFRRGK